MILRLGNTNKELSAANQLLPARTLSDPQSTQEQLETQLKVRRALRQ